MSADGGYDRRVCYDAIAGCEAKAAIPPRRGAKIWQHGNTKQESLARDENLRRIRQVGRAKWKRETPKLPIVAIPLLVEHPYQTIPLLVESPPVRFLFRHSCGCHLFHSFHAASLAQCGESCSMRRVLLNAAVFCMRLSVIDARPAFALLGMQVVVLRQLLPNLHE